MRSLLISAAFVILGTSLLDWIARGHRSIDILGCLAVITLEVVSGLGRFAEAHGMKSPSLSMIDIFQETLHIVFSPCIALWGMRLAHQFGFRSFFARLNVTAESLTWGPHLLEPRLESFLWLCGVTISISLLLTSVLQYKAASRRSRGSRDDFDSSARQLENFRRSA